MTCNRILVAFLVYKDFSLICRYFNCFLAVTGVTHEADDAYLIKRTCSCYWLDDTRIHYMDCVEVFNNSLDLSAIYFAHFSGC